MPAFPPQYHAPWLSEDGKSIILNNQSIQELQAFISDPAIHDEVNHHITGLVKVLQLVDVSPSDTNSNQQRLSDILRPLWATQPGARFVPVIRSETPSLPGISLEIPTPIVSRRQSALGDCRVLQNATRGLSNDALLLKVPLTRLDELPGSAPRGSRWVCFLCGRQKSIWVKSADLQRHLRKKHGYSAADVRANFNKDDEQAVWPLFGPYVYRQIRAHGWKISTFKDAHINNDYLARIPTLRPGTCQPTAVTRQQIPAPCSIIMQSQTVSSDYLSSHSFDDGDSFLTNSYSTPATSTLDVGASDTGPDTFKLREPIPEESSSLENSGYLDNLGGSFAMTTQQYGHDDIQVLPEAMEDVLDPDAVLALTKQVQSRPSNLPSQQFSFTGSPCQYVNPRHVFPPSR